MDEKGAIQGTVLLYIVLIIIVVIVILIFLQFLTPYKLSNFIESFISAAGNSGGGGRYA
ncbi:MAG: hypothetical protein M1433_00520 [Candidatus Parvarchaeota archaeon]|nr:hypothetical protein [Candidatus Parvarchaeota archaeon]